MCCRYYMELSPELRPIVEAAKSSRLYLNNIQRLPKPLTTEGEVFPEMLVPVLASNKSGEKTVFPMLWGYHVPGIARTIANAKIETAAEKTSFKDSWAAHRCVVPASWYYEWQHTLSPSGKTKTGDKYVIMPKDGKMTWLCGLYRMEENYPHFVILTRPPSESVAFIHDRMPFMLPEAETDNWINPKYNPHLLLEAAQTEMICEKETRRS